MDTLKHKVVVWGDYSIPVPVEARWLAQDEDGDWFAYNRKPKAQWGCWEADKERHRMWAISTAILDILPPEPGPWTEQLYWIN